jgi:hypothetical protein
MSALGRSPEGAQSLDRRLEDEYTASFVAMGMTPQEARSTAHEMVEKAKREVVDRGWSNRPPRYGDCILLLLQEMSTNEKVRGTMESLCREGVREDDLRWWWNLDPLEHMMLELADEQMHATTFFALLNQGLSPDEAGRKLWRNYVKFGNPEQAGGEDHPIPSELRRRVLQFAERHHNSPEVWREKTEKHSSMNALIRAEIRRGTL